MERGNKTMVIFDHCVIISSEWEIPFGNAFLSLGIGVNSVGLRVRENEPGDTLLMCG